MSRAREPIYALRFSSPRYAPVRLEAAERHLAQRAFAGNSADCELVNLRGPTRPSVLEPLRRGSAPQIRGGWILDDPSLGRVFINDVEFHGTLILAWLRPVRSLSPARRQIDRHQIRNQTKMLSTG